MTVIGSSARRRCQLQRGDDTPQAVRDPPFGYQAVVEAEGTQSGGIGGVPLRPTGSDSDHRIIQLSPIRRQLRRHGILAVCFKPANNMAAQGRIKILPRQQNLLLHSGSGKSPSV
jgi:hypothetical protein